VVGLVYGTCLFCFSDFGLSSAVGNALTLELRQGRAGQAERLLNAAWKFQAVAWLGIFCLLGVALILLPLVTGFLRTMPLLKKFT